MFNNVRSSCPGYTFIELLIALALLGLVITPILTLYSSTALMVSNSADYSVAVNLCRDKIEQLKALESSELEYFYLAGEFILEDQLPGYPGFERLTTVAPFHYFNGHAGGDNEPAENIMLSIDVTVRWVEGDHERSETVWTLVGLR